MLVHYYQLDVYHYGYDECGTYGEIDDDSFVFNSMHQVHNYIEGFVSDSEAFTITPYVEDDEADSLDILSHLDDNLDF
jgi:hypothetical protein